MEVITFSPDMDLSSKKAGDVFRLKLYGIEYDVKVVGDDEDPLMFCKDCIFFNNSERCLLSESQDWCLKKQVVYCKIRHDGEFNAKDANFLWRQIGRIDGVIETLNRTEGEMPEIIAGVLKRIRDDIDKFVDNKTKDYENIQE